VGLRKWWQLRKTLPRKVQDWELRDPPRESAPYWQTVRRVAAELEADGCTGVPDFYLLACLEHDIHYRTHRTLDGLRINRRQADMRLRRVIQTLSSLGRMSPMSWWRWAALRLIGWKAWRRNPLPLPKLETTTPKPGPNES